LYITPVYYVYIEGARLRLTRRRAKAAAAVEPLPQPVLPAAEPALPAAAMQRTIEGGRRA
jgi:hypothetical protein